MKTTVARIHKLTLEERAFVILDKWYTGCSYGLSEGDWNALCKAVAQGILDIRCEIIEECAAKIRADCQACGGTGIGRHEPATYVTHDMALDAEQPEREGSMYSQEICEECEYCGRPIASIRALLKEHI